MTRGYVCITKGPKILNVAYLNSDAYLSYYGLQILTAINTKGIKEWVENLRQEQISMYGTDDCKGFALNWIKPDKISKSYDNWSYAEYGYIYDASKNNLKVYHFGKLLLTIDCDNSDEVSKCIYLFKNENQIYNIISYDKDKLDDVKSFEKVIKEAVKMTENELKEIVKDDSERFYLSDYHCLANGHRPDREMYQKVLTSSCRNEELTFIIEHDVIGYTDFGWDVLIQTPVIRIPVTIGCKKFCSEKALMNALREFVKSRKNKLLRLAYVMEKFKYAEANDMLELFISEVDNMWDESQWFVGNMKYLTTDWFKKEAKNILYVQKRRETKAE